MFHWNRSTALQSATAGLPPAAATAATTTAAVSWPRLLSGPEPAGV